MTDDITDIKGSDLRTSGVYHQFVNHCKEKHLPIPPPNLIGHLEHHWLVQKVPDGGPTSYMIAQWSPSELKWYRSNEFATMNKPINLQSWDWLAHVPLPDRGLH